ncbi:MAG: hypothetical protein R3F56_05575 [Planctomycetota bacterium]
MRRLCLTLFTLACGGWAGAMLGRPARVTLPPEHEQTFRLAERERDPLAVTVGRPLLLPYCYGDCDLLATVAVPAGGELDLVMRRLDLDGGHGRFVLLRLSSTAEAWPWRTRDEALFADGPTGGVRLTPGLPASLRVEWRGRQVRANVAGRWLPPFRAADDRGSFAFVVRGGEAEVSHLQVSPLPRARSLSPPWLLGALCGLAVALLVGSHGAPLWRAVVAAATLPLAAAGVHAGLAARTVVGARLDAPALALVLAVLGLLTLAWARRGSWRRRTARLAAVLVVAAAASEVFCRIEKASLSGLQDPRLDLYFGVDSRAAPFDALAKLLHGKNEVHTADPALGRALGGSVTALRVVYLGGAPMMEANLDRAQHLAVQATAAVAQTLGKRCLPAVFPTAFPHTLQQTACFVRFYADAYPAAAVVLGVDRWDAQHEGCESARARLRAGAGTPPASFAWRALVGCRGDALVATPDELRSTVVEFVRFCKGRALPVLLATHQELPAPHLAAVEAAARAEDVPVVHAVMRSDESADVERLAGALVDLLAR